MGEFRMLRGGIRRVVLWAGGELLALIGLAYVVFVMLGVLLVTSQAYGYVEVSEDAALF